ncbi:cold-shock protein [Chloroflexota bacterium]
MAKSTIKRIIFDRGFGFIKGEQEQDLFFHRNELQDVEFTDLREGQEVEFEISRGRDGRPHAVKVKLTETENSQAETEVGSPDTETEDDGEAA